MGKAQRERRDRPLGTGIAEEKRERDGETDRQTERKRESWEVGRAFIKGNVVNVYRRCS